MNFRILSNHLTRKQTFSVSCYRFATARASVKIIPHSCVNRVNFNCAFHSTPNHYKIIPFLLADIGEGITECEVIQWYILYSKNA